MINKYKDYEIFPMAGSEGTLSLFDTTTEALLLSTCNDTSIDCIVQTLKKNATLQEEFSSFTLPMWRQIFWSVLFIGMVIIATGGNLIVVWIVVTNKRMRTVTNYFIVNLSIADAMVSSLNVTFNFIYMLHNDWPFGRVYCKISQFVAMLSISASVFTLMAISLDRYVAIMKPLRPRMSKRCNLAIAAIIWIVSTIIAYPMLQFFTTERVPSKNGIRTVCYAAWPDGETNYSTLEYIYNIVFMVLTYFIPITLMTVTYSRVGLELWGSKAIGEYTPRQVENVKSKRRVVKMMIVVVLIFAVCWLPFHAYFILTSCYPSITLSPFIQEVYLMIYWLAMSNSMYNPIIYCWMNSRFRYGFKLFFRWCPFVNTVAVNRRDQLASRFSCPGSPNQSRFKRNDTQKTIIYSCPGSMKATRLTHTGILRNSCSNGAADTSFHQQHNYHLRPNVSRNSMREDTTLRNMSYKHIKSHSAYPFTHRLEWNMPLENDQDRETQIISLPTETDSVLTKSTALMS